MLALLTYLLLFVTPLVVVPFFDLRFEPPKVLFAEFLIQILAVYSLIAGKFRLRRANPLLFAVVMALFLLSLYHLLVNPSGKNLFGNIFRLQGTILFWHFLALSLIAQNVYFKLKEKSVYVTSFIAVCLTALVFGSNSAGRLIGSLGEPNAFGAVVVFMLPFVLILKKMRLRILFVLAALLVVNFTQSKSALIGIGLELLFLALLKMKFKFAISVTICSILLVLSLILPISERYYFLKTNDNPFNYRFEDRAQIWQVSLIAGSESPVFGTGIESVQNRIAKESKLLNADIQYQTIDSAHNIFLDFWIWGGGTGLALLIGLIILTLGNLIRKRMTVETAVMIGLLAVLSFNPTTVSILAAFWWIIGRSFAEKTDKEAFTYQSKSVILI